jgi:TetR/AcrR family transcriptional regulator, tetracycline repressor protein
MSTSSASRPKRDVARTSRSRSIEARLLSEDLIVDAALRLIRRNGAAKLTMRELAAELGVSSMAAYHYLANKRELFSLVAEHVYAEVNVPSAELPWDERLLTLSRERRRAIRRYPGLPEALLGVDAEHIRRLENAELEILLEAGFPPSVAVPAARVLMDWTLGNAAIDSMLRDPHVRRPQSRWSNAQRMTRDDEELRRLHADDYFEFGLTAVVAGLGAVLDGT